jgi:CheY-like chemotaxis protein
MTEAASERTARVLLIQDAPDRRVAIAGALRRAGFEVIEVASGIAGLEAATTSRPDLLLIDLHLPDLDGAEVTSRLRRIGMKDLPIVAMGQPGTEHGIALSAGCNGTVPNPPDLEALPGQLREF